MPFCSQPLKACCLLVGRAPEAVEFRLLEAQGWTILLATGHLHLDATHLGLHAVADESLGVRK